MGSSEALILFYFAILIGVFIGATALRGLEYGLLSFLVIHTIIMLMGSIAVIPLPTMYSIVGTIVYVAVIVALISAYRKRK